MALIFVTGSTDGLGLAAAQLLSRNGHRVVLHARNEERAASIDELRGRAAGIAIGDLAIAEEVLSIADQVNALGRMDAVIHNAGVYRVPERGETPGGHATLLAINTLAPYILTARMMAPGRLIYLSSSLHRRGEGSLGDLDWRRREWDTAKAYAESKLHMVALAFAMARRWPGTFCNAVDPGWVKTRMGGASAPVDLVTGSRTQAWLAASDEPEPRRTGGYWHDQKRQPPSTEAADTAFQDRLLIELEGLTGIAMA